MASPTTGTSTDDPRCSDCFQRDSRGRVALPTALAALAALLLTAGCVEEAGPDALGDTAAVGEQVVTVRVHAVADLLLRGCDLVANPYSLACRWASHLACRERGHTGGFGVVEIGTVDAAITCVGGPALPVLLPYAGPCRADDPSSIWCDSMIRRHCIDHGYRTGTGVVGANPGEIFGLCVTAASAGEVATTVSELRAASANPGCDATTAHSSQNGCQHHAHRVCQQHGYSTGLGVVEFSDPSALIACGAGSHSDGAFRRGVDGRWERPLHLGANVLGSRVDLLAHETNHPDVVYNGTGEPLLIRRTDYGTTYDGRHGYSRDTCVYLNRMMIEQASENDDGEIYCTYSKSPTDPAQDFTLMGDRGVLIRPGERLFFHATPRWGRGPDGAPLGLGDSIWASFEVTALGNSAGLRRVRFPQWDTGYGQPVTIVAGNISDAPLPHLVPPGRPQRNSNWWYPVPQATTIRGMSVFVSGGDMHACIRVVHQGGAPVHPPRCFDLPNSFPARGQSVLPVEPPLPVPAGALVGVDFSVTQGDFAGYVWMDAP